jgi:hypothetical protein
VHEPTGVHGSIRGVFLDLTGGTWQAIGAAAGPVLALVALAWQASERLRRPRVDPTPGWMVVPAARDGRKPHDWDVFLTVNVRVVNPRSSTILTKSVELQAREPGGRRVDVIASDERPYAVKAGSEAVIELGSTRLDSDRDLRIVVKFGGATRPVRDAWAPKAGAAAFGKRDQMRERRRRAEAAR